MNSSSNPSSWCSSFSTLVKGVLGRASGGLGQAISIASSTIDKEKIHRVLGHGAKAVVGHGAADSAMGTIIYLSLL